ncbi:MAG: small multi-drug export protein [Desulfobacterales bacterium]
MYFIAMSDFKRLFLPLSQGLGKILLVLKNRFDLIEVKILFAGLFLSGLAGIYLFYILVTDPGLYQTLFSTAAIHVMGGRALGIATCLSADIPTFYTIMYNFYLEVVIVLLTYGIVVLFMRNIVQPKLFCSAVRQAELAAQDQKTRIKRFGAVGLFFFVMFPFFMTGPVIGAIIGYLLNYRAVSNFMIVFSGTLTSIVIYALVGNKVLEVINRYVHIDLIKKWGAIAAVILIFILLIYHLKTIKALLHREFNRD